MKSTHYKPISTRKLPKTDREQAVLVGLIELYLKSGKPVGSHTLQENGFGTLSSATIRNYLSKMEEEGYLKQPHTSGGRLPTEKALRLYAQLHRDKGILEKGQEKAIENALPKETREVVSLLYKAAEELSQISQCAVFFSMPRFDQDFIQEVKVVPLSPHKLLTVLVTDFGVVRTEILYLAKRVDPLFLQNFEAYFQWRINKGPKPTLRSDGEVKMAQRLYNEIMVRHVVGYAHVLNEEVSRVGLSKLLTYPEFNDAAALAGSLSLLEDPQPMRQLLREVAKNGALTFWIGDELCPHTPPASECSVVAIPYRVHQTIAGAIALLGPMRLPYRNLFGVVTAFGEAISRALTQSVYTYKMTLSSLKISENCDARTRNP
jgi:heat-inducible transcriptional repressor